MPNPHSAKPPPGRAVVMALYDGLPLNARTKVGGDGANYELWATRTQNGGTVETVLIGSAATVQANQATVEANLSALIASLQLDVDQDNQIIAGANPIIATSGALSTAVLSNHVRSLAQAAKTQALNDINNKKALANLLRKITGKYDDLTGT